MAQIDAGDRPEHDAIALLRDGPCRSMPPATAQRLAAGGTLIDVLTGAIVYTEADVERFAVVVRGLIRVYMHTSDGRQVTVRYVRRGGLLGAPALVAGPAPVFVQALADSTLYFMDVANVKRLAGEDAAVAWMLAEECVHRLYDVLEELAGNTFAAVRQRVVRHLFDLAASRPAADGRLAALVNQQELASRVTPSSRRPGMRSRAMCFYRQHPAHNNVFRFSLEPISILRRLQQWYAPPRRAWTRAWW